MEIKNNSFHSDNLENPLKFDKLPNSCPLCYTAFSINPYIPRVNIVNQRDYYDSQHNAYPIQAIFRCPKCFHLFISTYCRQPQGGYQFYLINNSPCHPQKISFKKEIEELSPNFIEIYQQSNYAEKINLSQVAGCGYRKSLEFLVKDYCIKHLKKDKSTIANKSLGLCIKEDLGCPNVKDCAERAAWIGNDETHYTKKWKEHDISTLKNLIELTQNWINTNILTDKFKIELSNKSK